MHEGVAERMAVENTKSPETPVFKSWREVMDRYMVEKRDSLDTSDTTIQTLWFADFLARRRQARLGVKSTEYYKGKDRISEAKVWDSGDGRCKRTTVYTQLERTIEYSLGDDKLVYKRNRPTMFSILTTESKRDRHSCPNCGSVSTTEECMDGCPFCGTKFRLTDYTCKLAGQYEGITNLKPELLLIICGIISFVWAFVWQLIENPYPSVLMILFQSLVASMMLAVLLYGVAALILGVIFFARLVIDDRLNAFCRGIRRNDPHFSTDEFHSEFLSRVRAFFLSEEGDDLRYISGIKGGQHTDIVDVHISHFKKFSTLTAPGYFIARAFVVLVFVGVKNDKLVREKATFAIDLYRADSARTELVTDQQVFTCPSCASSISILEGGYCKFCGTSSDLSRHGWMLGAVTLQK
jgi:endogenous inhibitor of DNA gyrase (YacG/DUF329 family)